jgi:8-oxo-dGTP pyrophosphatase MutT (NUDIX family)
MKWVWVGLGVVGVGAGLYVLSRGLRSPHVVLKGDEPSRGAGLKITAQDTGRTLLLRRTDTGRYWSYPGGHARIGESDFRAAIREVNEEIVNLPPMSVTEDPPLFSAPEPGFVFTAFAAQVSQEFAPKFGDAEHDDFRWVHRASELQGVHPGILAAGDLS